jgi:hypothetical protein
MRAYSWLLMCLSGAIPAVLFGTRVAETILASGPARPHQQAGHMDASDPIRPLKKILWHGGVHIWVPAFAGTTC